MSAQRTLGVRVTLVSVLTALVAVALAQAAAAADRVYWTNGTPPTVISFANLDGSGGGNLAMPGGGRGLALDLSVGRIYWAQGAPTNKISFANLDGSGVGDLPTGTATVDNPAGLAIDPIARRIYWANNFGNKISFASLDGSGGGDLPTGAASVANPDGVAIDLAARRIYWTNAGGNKISFASLDGSGGGDLPTGAATVDTPRGPAIDPVAGRIYWSNSNGISFASLDGSGAGGNLATTGASGPFPLGLAIDPSAGRIYFANGGNKISYANLDGTGGGNDLPTTGANVNSASYPALVKAPSSTGAPAISGDSATGSVLSCSQGSWASDLFGANLYQQPQSFTYEWSRGGNDIAGATASSYTADAPGEYRCTATASNIAGAGAASAPSEPFVVADVPPNDISFGKLKRNTARGTATLIVNVPGAGELTVGGRGVAPQRSSRQTRAPARAVGPPWQVSVTIRPRGKAKARLAKAGKLTLKAKVTFTPTGGSANTEIKRIKLLKR